MSGNPEVRQQLESLATLYGVELSYYDIKGRQFVASDEALLTLLPQLGARVEGLEDVPAALAARRRALTTEVFEPVFVFWDDALAEVTFTLPSGRDGVARLHLTLEDETQHEMSQQVSSLPRVGQRHSEGEAYVTYRFGLGRTLPHGYHRARLSVDGSEHEALLLCAPTQAWAPPRERLWGLFSPAYALRSEADLGVGGVAELERLVDLTRELGGRIVGTLPLTATFLKELASPSPYGPVSRLFWNELYIDIERLPELEHSADARALLASDAFRTRVAALRERDTVDHVEAMALIRPVLERLTETAFAEESPTRAALLARLESTPRLADYARFRATVEKQGTSWHGWEEAAREGSLSASLYDEAAFRYHVYVQARIEDQLAQLGERAAHSGGGLYLDLPLGVHPDGFDAWRFRDQFLSASSAGAPPDDLFEGGQDWGFRPLDPDAIRRSGYEYVISCMRRQFAFAGALRIDHVMGLHRIFTIPHGLGGDQGLYLRYRAEELYAILTLESHRNQCFIIGEDLGTVPNEVRESMDRHGLLRMYVAQFSLTPDRASAVRAPSRQVVASINTHDTPTFASFWEDRDISLRVELEHTDEVAARHEREARRPMRSAVVNHLRDRDVLGPNEETSDVLGGMLNLLASSEAPVLLVNLEDLWGEPRAQNVPGTVDEHPNWQNRGPHLLEELVDVPGVFDTLREIDRRRS